MNGWGWLALAIGLEVVGTLCLKLSAGLTRPGLFAITLVSYGLAFTMLALALQELKLGLAYAVWAGVGTALVALLGVMLFDERLTLAQIASIGLIVLGVAGLYGLGGRQA